MKAVSLSCPKSFKAVNSIPSPILKDLHSTLLSLSTTTMGETSFLHLAWGINATNGTPRLTVDTMFSKSYMVHFPML